MKAIGIIPARYASTRFPGKPLVDINGKSMIRRVYEQALQSKSLEEVFVATDDERIYRHVCDFGGNVVMTSGNHASGTSRVEEVVQQKTDNYSDISFDIVVNIQGDEPFIQPEQIDLVCSAFENKEAHIATLIQKISNIKDIFNPNCVKTVTDCNGKALMFTRATIPFVRGKEQAEWHNYQTYYKHIGMYAYTVNALREIVHLPPSPIEISESLEQLRWLYNGYSIYTKITTFETIGIDTPEDLQNISQRQINI